MYRICRHACGPGRSGVTIVGEALDIVQVADAGAAALMAEMIRTSWESFRTSISKLLHRDGAQGAEQVLQLVDTARQQLVDSPVGERAAVEERLRRELMIQLAAFLQRHPDAATELEDLAEQADVSGEARSRTSIQNNTNSQIVVSGGSISASGGFHYRSPEVDR
jgi:hypothetical protein